jgi:hypothetical protein
MLGFHLLDWIFLLLFLGLWLLPATLVLRDSGRRPPAGRALGRRCAIFGLPGALVYFGLLRVHQRLQAGKQERMLR